MRTSLVSGRRISIALTVTIVATLGIGIVNAPPAGASSITVNTALDIPVNPATQHFPTDGLCSLRAAIRAAQSNSNASDVDCTTGAPVPNVLDVIQIDPSLAGETLTLSASAGGFDAIFDMTNPLEIVGPTLDADDFVIHGGNQVRPFVVGALNLQPGDLTLANLTVAGGNATGSTLAVDGDGGALFAGYFSKLTFDNVVFRDSNANRGGAVYAQAPTITNNGGAYTSNHASNGGAIFLEEGPSIFNGYAMLLDSNTASLKGGAIASNTGSANPFIHIERSLIKGNAAPTGGVMYVEPVGPLTDPAVTFELEDSTVTGNSSVFTSTSTRQLYDYERITFVDTGTLWNGTGGGRTANSIITGATQCFFSVDVTRFVGVRNLVRPFQTPGDCGVRGMNPLGEVTNLSPTLAQNGGPEVQRTYALLEGSNAIDNGSPDYCGTIDARSVERGLDGNNAIDSPQPGDCDIGAYEFARFVVNFVTGTSSVNEGAAVADVQVRLRILDATLIPLPQPVTIPITNDPSSTATVGNDFTVTGGGVTFPAGSVDGAVQALPITILQDDIAELFGELAHLDLAPSVAGIAIAEPRRHNLSIQDDDQPGVVVSDGGDGTHIAEATPLAEDAITVRLQSRPDFVLLDPEAPGDPASYGPPADVDVTVTPDRDCVIRSGDQTGTPASPLTFSILNDDWQVEHPISVRAVDDLYDEDLRDETAPHVCELRFAFSSLDPIYDATEDAYEVAVADDDVAHVNVGYVSGTSPLAEGTDDALVYSVSLDTPPDPGDPLPATPRGPTGVVFTPSGGCLVNGAESVTLPFTEANYSTPQTVTVTAADDTVVELLHDCTVSTRISSQDPVYADLDDDPAFAHTPHDITTSVQDYDPPDVPDDPPFVNIDTDGGVTLDEAAPGAPRQVSVVLERAPLAAPVTVTLSSLDDPRIAGPQLTMAPATTLTFTPDDWDVPQVVDVAAVDDDFDEADTHPWSIGVAVDSTAVGFDDESLRRIVVDGVEVTGPAVIPVSIADDDTSALAPIGSPTVTEGGATGSITLQLATHPYGDVSVVVTADDQCTVNGQPSTTVTFPAASWNVAQPIAIAAVDDVDLEESLHDCVVSYDAGSADPRYDVLTATSSASVVDNDVAEVLATPGGRLTVGEGGALADSFDIVLASRPAGTVTVTIGTDSQTAARRSVTFTRLTWDTPRSVTVSAVDDDVDEPAIHPGTITLGVVSTALGYDSAVIKVDGVAGTTIGVDVADDDTAGVAIAASALSVREAAPNVPATYSVVLTSEPLADVTVTITAPDGQTVAPATVVFTPQDWQIPHPIATLPVDDTIVEASRHSGSLLHAVDSTDPAYASGVPITVDGTPGNTVVVSIGDDDTTTRVRCCKRPRSGVVIAGARVDGGDAPVTGTVQFAVDGVSSGAPVTLQAGRATVALGTLPAGTYTLTATYSGDGRHEPSTGSATFTIGDGPKQVPGPPP